ncbi:unnamed protein product [Clonostachys rhizophaga]|uniref:Uncharacterized protein n=1 Tax=Clonostachys rhizophaga TaxID=160324 RepID=A0A9N9YF32_9HYPO|nr:unnamed protein product [Clonostachys rhizophaga]
MVTVTILGAGTAPPGDPFDKDDTSQWAGACWVGVPMSSPRDQRIQLESFAVLWRLAKIYPESGLRRSKMTEIFEYGACEEIWCSSKIPGFRWLDANELPAAASFGMECQTLCISPPVFLSWMRQRLEARGVQFHHSNVRSLAELRDFGHDVLIIATGARTKDPNLAPYRLQTLVAKKDDDECYIYRGNREYYLNMFGRPDSTTFIGGIKTLRVNYRTVYDQGRQTVSPPLSPPLTTGTWSMKHDTDPGRNSRFWRVDTKNCPQYFLPQIRKGYEILYDIANT